MDTIDNIHSDLDASVPAQPTESTETLSLLSRIGKIGSGIYKKITCVFSTSTSMQLTSEDIINIQTQNGISCAPAYTRVSSGNLKKQHIKHDISLQDKYMSKRPKQAAVANPELNRQKRDLFEHLSEQPQEERTANHNVPPRRDNLIHEIGLPARVIPRNDTAIDDKFENDDLTEFDVHSKPDLSTVFESKFF